MQGKALEEESARSQNTILRYGFGVFWWRFLIFDGVFVIAIYFSKAHCSLKCFQIYPSSLSFKKAFYILFGLDGRGCVLRVTSDIMKATQLISTLAALHPRSASISLLHNSLKCLGAAGSWQRKITREASWVAKRKR